MHPVFRVVLGAALLLAGVPPVLAGPPAARPPRRSAPAPEAPPAPALSTAAPEPAPVPAVPERAHQTTVLVMPLRGMGVSADVTTQCTHFVAQAFALHPEYALATLADVEKSASVAASQVAMGCASESCMAELSKALHAELLVTGSVGTLGGKTTVTLVLIEAATSTARNRVSGVVETTKRLPQDVPGLVATLLGWNPQAAPARFALPAGKRTSIAVLDLTPNGVSDPVAANLTQLLSTELKKVDGTSIIGREDIRAMLQLQEQKTLVGCDDMSCLAEIGGALGVEKLVTGNVGKLGDSYVVSLRLITARQARVDNLVSESFAGSEDQLIRAVKRAGRKLLGVDATEAGTLVVGVSEQSAEVFVDGARRGNSPLPPLAGLPAGLHSLQVSKSGYVAWKNDVYVEPTETSAVWVDLVARPTPWFRKWWVWTLMGTSGAGVVLATVAVAALGTGSLAMAIATARYFQQGTVGAHVTVH